ncbi:uncharacterized protein EV420DRAFT_1636446 [Desarmillaria tabescens]|uniref:Uncharacterized protein n=1 Tax=Armillaria tabescens TaxID=1929756 RepID=A0AA39TTF0_ARMTA|nr:uncharacterized protein EV420DRAFT_1636446 [Desarmillaria tabescens]KAK0465883.1 hypothetical protein EV420DRAFT_1636446 [Desarmillaria tabescens]
MAAQTSIPPDLSDADRTIIFQSLDTELNSRILYSLLTGLYTGVVAVMLWNIFTNKSRPVGWAIVVVITLLYIVTNLWTENVFYGSPGVTTIISAGTASAIGTILADSTMIWRCWIVWGRQWVIVLLPILFLLSATAFKIVATLLNSCSIHPSLLATTFWCTALIVYRIVTVGGEAVGGGVRTYRHIIEVLVESSALYSACLILYVGFYARDSYVGPYFDILAGSARGIAPTLLVGRVAAGHARPDDSWQGSVVLGSLRFTFGTHTRGHGSTMSDDPEAQREGGNEYGHPILSAESRGNGLDAQQDRPEDDPNTVLVVSRD